MSSACVCHTNEWCFYCEMYIPLENKHDLAVKALEKLRQTNADNFQEIRKWKENQYDPDIIDLDWYNYVAESTLEEIKTKLKCDQPNGEGPK